MLVCSDAAPTVVIVASVVGLVTLLGLAFLLLWCRRRRRRIDDLPLVDQFIDDGMVKPRNSTFSQEKAGAGNTFHNRVRSKRSSLADTNGGEGAAADREGMLSLRVQRMEPQLVALLETGLGVPEDLPPSYS